MMWQRVSRTIRKKIKSFDDESGMGYWLVRATLSDGRVFDNVYINDFFQIGFPDLTPFAAADIVDVEWGGYRGSKSSGVPVLVRDTASNSRVLWAYFDDCAEIRMGSPFRLCRLRLDGAWIPLVPNDQGWQNLSAASPNGRFVALVRWDVVGNEPGFRILTVDCDDRTVQTTERIPGCCESLAWRDETFVPTIWHPPANENL
jgi:hypothetical protein